MFKKEIFFFLSIFRFCAFFCVQSFTFLIWFLLHFRLNIGIRYRHRPGVTYIVYTLNYKEEKKKKKIASIMPQRERWRVILVPVWYGVKRLVPNIFFQVRETRNNIYTYRFISMAFTNSIYFWLNNGKLYFDSSSLFISPSFSLCRKCKVQFCKYTLDDRWIVLRKPNIILIAENFYLLFQKKKEEKNENYVYSSNEWWWEGDFNTFLSASIDGIQCSMLNCSMEPPNQGGKNNENPFF